jgi:predicted extracellular nuclease
VGLGGRLPPTAVISGVTGYVEDAPSLVLSRGLDFYESLEGMRLEIHDAQAVSRTNQFGEVWVVGDAGAAATGVNPRGGVTIGPADFNPERIQLEDGIVAGATAGVTVSDHLGTITGVLGYDFGNFELDVLAPLTVAPGGLTPESTELKAGPSHLLVATFNVENLDPGDTSDPAFGGDRFAALANLIVHNLGAPDILGLSEVQDNNGPANDGTVAAGQTLGMLLEAIGSAEPALTGAYAVAQIDPEDGQDGGEPGGNIRVAILYRTDRVQLVPGTAGNAVTNTTVGPGPMLSHNPGRLLDTDLGDGDAFADSRKPLVAHFRFNRASVFVVGNHFNSKGGDQGLIGPSQPPALISEVQRRHQATIVRGFVDQLLAKDPRANVIVLGDLNDFPFSPPLDILRGNMPGGLPLADVVSLLPSEDRYTFIFDGNSQALDNILVSPRLARGAKGDIVHVNSEFLVQASDHDPIVARLVVTPVRGD